MASSLQGDPLVRHGPQRSRRHHLSPRRVPRALGRSAKETTIPTAPAVRRSPSCPRLWRCRQAWPSRHRSPSRRQSRGSLLPLRPPPPWPRGISHALKAGASAGALASRTAEAWRKISRALGTTSPGFASAKRCFSASCTACRLSTLSKSAMTGFTNPSAWGWAWPRAGRRRRPAPPFNMTEAHSDPPRSPPCRSPPRSPSPWSTRPA